MAWESLPPPLPKKNQSYPPPGGPHNTKWSTEGHRFLAPAPLVLETMADWRGIAKFSRIVLKDRKSQVLSGEKHLCLIILVQWKFCPTPYPGVPNPEILILAPLLQSPPNPVVGLREVSTPHKGTPTLSPRPSFPNWLSFWGVPISLSRFHSSHSLKQHRNCSTQQTFHCCM